MNTHKALQEWLDFNLDHAAMHRSIDANSRAAWHAAVAHTLAHVAGEVKKAGEALDGQHGANVRGIADLIKRIQM